MEPEELPLQVGDTVKYDHYAAGPGVSGIIVECLSDDYLCVQWSDLSVVTKHRSHNLKRWADRRRWRH